MEFVNAPNATGVMLEFPASIQLKWLRRFLPDAKRVGVLCNLQKNRQLINKLKLEAEKLRLELIAVNVETPRELPAALKSLSRLASRAPRLPSGCYKEHQPELSRRLRHARSCTRSI
ncbi:MAG: hypothetical protein KAI50_11480 [Desulfobacterales bacterium]|nr:hypothetical protein [Desulfobacterales bacterium]